MITIKKWAEGDESSLMMMMIKGDDHDDHDDHDNHDDDDDDGGGSPSDDKSSINYWVFGNNAIDHHILSYSYHRSSYIITYHHIDIFESWWHEK